MDTLPGEAACARSARNGDHSPVVSDGSTLSWVRLRCAGRRRVEAAEGSAREEREPGPDSSGEGGSILA